MMTAARGRGDRFLTHVNHVNSVIGVQPPPPPIEMATGQVPCFETALPREGDTHVTKVRHVTHSLARPRETAGPWNGNS